MAKENKKLEDLVGDPINHYAPDDVGHNNNIMSNDFAGHSPTNGLKAYDRVGHQMTWFIPSPNSAGINTKGEPHAMGRVDVINDRIIPTWSHKENTATLSEPLSDSTLLMDFINLFKGVENPWAKESTIFVNDEIKEFCEEHGTLISQPLDRESKSFGIENNVGGKYPEETVSGFLEHWFRVKEIYDLSTRAHSPQSVRKKLNYIMKEITLAVYPKGKFMMGDEDTFIKSGDGGIHIVSEDENHILGYRIPSLRAVITLMLMELITGHIKEQVCDECGDGFVSKKSRREGQNNFCSNKCGNKFRVKKSYRKKNQKP